jgi:hypothetical protein
MAGPRAQGRFSLAEPAVYSYFEARGERFGWFRDPSDEVITVPDLSGQERAGLRHWFILLRHGRTGWRVDKPMEASSLEDARTMAAMEWAGRVGYLVDLIQGAPVLGPHQADLADPVRYLQLMKSTKSRRRPSDSGQVETP